MAVYPGLPFVVFDSTLRNPSKDSVDTHAVALFTAELVTAAGTSVIVSGPTTEPIGGLNKTYNTFAALLPFMQQHGAVVVPSYAMSGALNLVPISGTGSPSQLQGHAIVHPLPQTTAGQVETPAAVRRSQGSGHSWTLSNHAASAVAC